MGLLAVVGWRCGDWAAVTPGAATGSTRFRPRGPGGPPIRTAVVTVVASVLDPIYTALGNVLAFFYSIFPSFAFAIAMLTITVRMALIPLTAKQVKSQQAMQRVQPEMKRLQAKHKGDRQKLNEEMMKLYKEHQVNPLSGCLPILLQMPLFIVLYRLIMDLSKVPPRNLPIDSKLHAALAESGGRMMSFGMDLADKASGVQGFGTALPYYLLIAAVVATGFYQQRQMTARMPAGSINPQMQIIGKVFPAMMGLISLSIPAGVVVYFVVSNLWQIGQQAVTFRAQGPLPAPTTAKDKAIPAKGGPKGSTGGAKEGGGGGKGGTGGAKGGAGGGKQGRATTAKGAPSSDGADEAPKSSWWRRPAGGAARPGRSKKPPSPSKGTTRAKNARNAKGRRPPPSPRPKGLPPSRPRGAKGPRATPPKKDR